MHNSIRVSLEFSFKGETYSPSAVIELDSIDGSAGPPDWHAVLASMNNIDTYSYAYEVMQTSELHFSDASGLAVYHLHDGQFDFVGFIQARGGQQAAAQLESIARDFLGIADLDAEPRVQAALRAAFELGKASRD